jgi:hypothetical protein
MKNSSDPIGKEIHDQKTAGCRTDFTGQNVNHICRKQKFFTAELTGLVFFSTLL